MKIIICSVVCSLCVASFSIGVFITVERFHQELITKGFAHYNETNGQWEYVKKDVLLKPNTDILNTAQMFYNDDLVMKPTKKITKTK